MSPTVLVVGGYGAVGDPLCRALAVDGLRPIIAGRNPQKGVELAYRLGTTARRLDLADPATWDAALAGVDLVAICMDQADTGFVRHLFERGLHYVDVTASDGFFRALEALPKPGRSAALLSVGLAPGLTNMLAAALVSGFDRPTRIDIGMLFGLGDRHGAAGLNWMAERIFDPARRRDPRRHQFGAGFGARTAHVVDFSDQHALMRTMPGAAVTTRVAFDSCLATAAVFGAATWFAGSAPIRRLARLCFSAIRLGSRTVNVSVEAAGCRDGSLGSSSIRFLAEEESQTTARLAALMIRMFMDGSPAAGIWHSHEVLDPTQFLWAVGKERIGEIEWSDVPASARAAAL